MNAPKVVILSAGRGFRLNPLTLERPKSLCPIANVSILRRQLEFLKAAGLESAVLALSPEFQSSQVVADHKNPTGFSLEVVFPGATSLGQVGMVRECVGAYSGPVLVIYGDSLLKADFRQLLKTHAEHRASGGLATILYHRPLDLRTPEKEGRTYHGILSLREDGRIRRFKEKPLVSEVSPGFDLANAAVFVIERELLDAKEFAVAKNFSFDIFEPAVSRSLPIYGADIGEGYRFDIGGLSRWYDLNLSVLNGEIDSPIPYPQIRTATWIGDNYGGDQSAIVAPAIIGTNVSVESGATIGPSSIVGDGCRVGSNTKIDNSILLEGCTIGRNTRISSGIIGPYSIIGDEISLPNFTCLGAFSVVGAPCPNWADAKGFSYA